MDNLTPAEEVLLLSLDPRSGRRREKERADCAVVGALLVELAAAGRICVEKERVVVRDASPLGRPAEDTVLTRLQQSPRARRPQHWVYSLRGTADGPVRQALLDKRVIRHDTTRVWGLFPRSRFPEADARFRKAVRGRLASVVLEGVEPCPRTAVLIAVLHGAGLHQLALGQVTGRAQRRAVRDRMEAVSRQAWAAPAVRKAVESVQAAMTAVMVAATTAATTTGGQ